MTDDTPTVEQIRARHEGLFGVAAGYLPADIDEVTRWLERQLARAKEAHAADELVENPAVSALGQLIRTDDEVRTLFELMLEESGGKRQHGQPITSLADLLVVMNLIVAQAPQYTDVKSERNFFPMSSLFVHMMYKQAGMELFAMERFNSAVRAVLQSWCDFLDSSASLNVINKGDDGWLSLSATRLMNLKDFVIPEPSAPNGGFASFNDYFHREINLETRQLAGEGDPKVIVSANDGTVYRIARDVQQKDANFWLKGQPYSLENMLNNINENGVTVDSFVGGDVFQAFLSGANYHRWRAPVSGTIVAQRLVEGLMFSELPWPGYDPSAGTLSQGYQASVNTRGLIFIKADYTPLRTVCVMPIGITEISSIRFTRSVNHHVAKGDELGYFSYGGSTLCLVFQPGAVSEFRWPWPPQDPKHPLCPPCAITINVRDWIALAN